MKVGLVCETKSVLSSIVDKKRYNIFLYGQTDFFAQIVANFLGQSPFHPSDKLHAQNLFHSDGKMLNPIPFQQELAILDASHAFLLTAVFFDSSSPHWNNYKGNTSPTVWVLEQVKQPTCSCDNLGRLCCQRSGRLWQEKLKNWPPITTKCPAQPVASLSSLPGGRCCIPPITIY